MIERTLDEFGRPGRPFQKTFFFSKDTHWIYWWKFIYLYILIKGFSRYWAYQFFSDVQRGNVEGLEETGNTDWSIPGGTLERAGNKPWPLAGRGNNQQPGSGFRGRIPTYGYWIMYELGWSSKLGGVFFIFFSCSPPSVGEMSQCDEHIFQMGRNHQLEKKDNYLVLSCFLFKKMFLSNAITILLITKQKNNSKQNTKKNQGGYHSFCTSLIQRENL